VAPGECDEFCAQFLDCFERPHLSKVLVYGLGTGCKAAERPLEFLEQKSHAFVGGEAWKCSIKMRRTGRPQKDGGCLRSHSAGVTVEQEVRTFETTTSGLLDLSAWLSEKGCTLAAMETTGVYWKPVWHCSRRRV
jgi:hypothetical protein